MGWILLAAVAGSIAWRLVFRYYLVHRFSAPRILPDDLHRKMTAGEDVLILDLRRDHDYDPSGSMVEGAVRIRPASFHRVAHQLPRDRDLVFYCT
jgi:rhodanese-related sulfurtransferase